EMREAQRRAVVSIPDARECRMTARYRAQLHHRVLAHTEALRVARHGGRPAEELGAVAPRGDLVAERRADAHEFEAPARLGQADVVGGIAEPRLAKQSFALLHGLPALLEWREVPATARRAHDPEASLGGVEGNAAPDGQADEHVVAAQVVVAKKAGRIHRSQ